MSEDIAQRFGEGDLFRLVMLAMIVLNSVQIGVQTDDNLVRLILNTYFHVY